MGELNEMGCAGLADVAAELALGALTGHERAEALAHLDRCHACRENVCRLMVTGEVLLAVLPTGESPLGFETRVLERLGLSASDRGMTSPPSQDRRLRRRPGDQQGRPGLSRRVLAVTAAATGAVAAGLGGWGLRSLTSPASRVPLSSAALISPGHRAVGEIFAYGGSPGWVCMSVAAGGWNGTVICELAGKDGRVTTVGSFLLTDGHGSWGSPNSLDNRSLSGARLVATDGTVLATASFARS